MNDNDDDALHLAWLEACERKWKYRCLGISIQAVITFGCSLLARDTPWAVILVLGLATLWLGLAIYCVNAVMMVQRMRREFRPLSAYAQNDGDCHSLRVN